MFPVVPMPVFPYPNWDRVCWADPRASNVDRDVAADILCAAVADGRLTLAELDERLEDVLSARTLREIARLISDLSGPWLSEGPRLSGPVRLPGTVRPAIRPAAPPRSRSQPPAETRWSLLQSLLAPAGFQHHHP
ncbi:MAG: DUF1707 SHOCT-like domain-containing protein [Trebonia sp.]